MTDACATAIGVRIRAAYTAGMSIIALEITSDVIIVARICTFRERTSTFFFGP